MSYHGSATSILDENPFFRVVLYTGEKSQLVVMTIPPGGEVGQETHAHVEQTLYFLSGTGEGMLNDNTFPIGPGDVVTVYAPPNHIDGRIHHTKADADADAADEAFGVAQC